MIGKTKEQKQKERVITDLKKGIENGSKKIQKT